MTDLSSPFLYLDLNFKNLENLLMISTKELCVGAYKFGEEDTYHYAPFNKVEGDA